MPFWFLLLFVITLGAIWGSFVGALTSRWPQGESVARGRSHCAYCSKTIAAADLVPIFSYFWLNGKCRYCHEPIGLQAIVVELGSVAIGVVSLVLLSGSQALAAAILGWLLLPLVVLDYRHLWLPDRLILLLVIVGLFVAPVLTGDVMWAERIAGMAMGFLGLEAVRQAYKKFRQRDGLGAGDPKFFGTLGLWLGWQALPITLLIASFAGLLSVPLMALMGNRSRGALPFGSYLGFAAFFVVLMR